MKYWYEIGGKKEGRGSKRQKKKSLMMVVLLKPATPFSRCTATEYISEDVVGQVYMLITKP